MKTDPVEEEMQAIEVAVVSGGQKWWEAWRRLMALMPVVKKQNQVAPSWAMGVHHGTYHRRYPESQVSMEAVVKASQLRDPT